MRVDHHHHRLLHDSTIADSYFCGSQLDLHRLEALHRMRSNFSHLMDLRCNNKKIVGNLSCILNVIRERAKCKWPANTLCGTSRKDQCIM